MHTMCDQLIDDHRHCDALFLEVEKQVAHSLWDNALTSFSAFSATFRQHLTVEETTFFPLIKQMGGEDAWPLKDLQADHAKLETILLRLEAAIGQRSKGDFLLHAESFFILMDTHSIKEEQMLYPTLELKNSKTPGRSDFGNNS